MNRLFLLAISLFIAFSIYGQPAKYQTESQVKKVTIYPSGARVERAASVSVLPGRSEINFVGLSNQLDQQSVQLSSDADITLLSVHTTKDFLGARKIENDEREFLQKSNELQDKLEMDKKMLEVYKDEETMLEKNQFIAGQQGVKLSDLKEALDFQRQRRSELFAKELEIQKNIKAEEQKLQTIQKQMTEISKKKDSVNYSVTALVESKSASQLDFKLSYNVKDAGWYPAYDVRFKDLSDPIHITMNANVYQQSGESWKNISLELSTGNPNANATAAPLEPWYLDYYDPSVSFRGRGSNSGSAAGRVTDEKGMPVTNATVSIKGSQRGAVTDDNGYFMLQNVPTNATLVISSVGYQTLQMPFRSGYFSIALKQSTSALNEVVVIGYSANERVKNDEDIGKKLEGKVAGVQIGAVTVLNQPTTVVYEIKDLHSLETDGKITTIGIKDLQAEALFQYYTAPKVDLSSFLTAELVNWKDLDLQSGEASLYFEGSYLGKTYLDLSQAMDTLTLSLGKDNGVKVTRKMIKKYGSKSFIGSNRTESREYEINLQNTKKDTVTITIKDQFPVSSNKEIEIESQQAPEGQIDKATGIVTWQLNLIPGQQKKLQLSYSVKYPKGKNLVLD